MSGNVTHILPEPEWRALTDDIRGVLPPESLMNEKECRDAFVQRCAVTGGTMGAIMAAGLFFGVRDGQGGGPVYVGIPE